MSAWDPGPGPTTPPGPAAHSGSSVRGLETLPSLDFATDAERRFAMSDIRFAGAA
jgi:hypothetical protein